MNVTCKRRIISVFLTAVIACAALSSCASSSVAMRYGDAVITNRMYYYWLTQYKSYFLSSFDGAEDTDTFWLGDAGNGMTTEEYLNGIVQMNIKKNLVCMKLFDDYHLELSDDAKTSIENDMKDLLESYGSRSELNAELALSGINDTIMRQIYTIQEEITALYNYLYGDSGTSIPTDDELDNYYREHYTRIKYVTLNLFNSETDAAGKTTSTALSDEELNGKRALASSLKEQISGGADIDALISENSEADMTGYENGVYISTNNTGYDIIDQALAMKVGEVKVIEQEHAIYVVEKLELENKPYLSDAMNQFSDLLSNCSDEVFQNMLLKLADEITVNEDVISAYPLRDAAYGTYKADKG